MGKAVIEISTQLLRDLLYLPDDVEVIGAKVIPQIRLIRLLVQSGQFAELEHGKTPVVTPVIETIDAPETRKFLKWV